LSTISFISFMPPQAVTFLSVNNTCISFTCLVLFDRQVNITQSGFYERINVPNE